jgi:hypothetical protein
MIDDIRPKGPAHDPAPDGDLDLLLEGMADNYEVVRAFVSTLSDIRDPKKTPVLSDLEAEYGIPTSTLLSEAERRLRLDEFAYGGDSDGTEDDLQTALRNAGFDVYVYQNDPAVDPAIFLEQQFQMVAGGDNAYAGRDDAFCGLLGGELLVNGDVFKTSKVFTSVAGTMYAGDGTTAGEYDDLLVEKIEYPIPTDPADWPMVYFVGGAATRDFIEMLTNGGFETGDFTGWTQNNSVIDITNPATGTYASKLDTATGIAGCESDKTGIDPLRKYTLKIKTDITSWVAGTYSVGVVLWDKDGLPLTPRSGIAIYSSSAVTGGYIQTEVTLGRIGTGADIEITTDVAQISIANNWAALSNGIAFLDDVELYRSDKQSITEIGKATVDGSREDEFKRTILKYGPMHAWAALIVTFA